MTVSVDVSTTTAPAPKRGSNLKVRLATVAVVGVLLLLWELLPALDLVPEIILPRFSNVMLALFTMVTGPTFFRHLNVTLTEILVGFVIGTILGFILGVALGLSDTLKRVTYPIVIAFQSIPKIVLAPLIITWFGYGIDSKIAMAVVIGFFPVLINTMVGLESVPDVGVKLMRSLRASPAQQFWKLSLPYAAPLVFAGIKTGLTFAVIGAIVGEFVGASEGLGYLLNTYSFSLRIDRVYAVIVVLSIIGSLLYFIIDRIDRRVIFWRSSSLR